MLFNLRSKDKKQQSTVPLLSLTREQLLEPLQMVAGVIERQTNVPILANILMAANENVLTITATDSEIELVSWIELDSEFTDFHPITLSARKLIEICRTLPEGGQIDFFSNHLGQVTLVSKDSRFTLATLPANEFPLIQKQDSVVDFTIKQKILKNLANKTYFAIPPQEVRSYLSGMLLEVKDGVAKSVASDTIRLALNSALYSDSDKTFAQIIIPRRAVMEMVRFLSDRDDDVQVGLNNNYIKITGTNFDFTSRLISGRFPNYNNHIPRKLDKKIVVNRQELKQALLRINILSSEILRSFRFLLQDGVLQLIANNPECEEAIEKITVDYTDEPIAMIFNVSYLLDILNNLDTEFVVISLRADSGGITVENIEDKNSANNSSCLYVLMSIRHK